jgi:hypothetical protein
MKVSNLWEAAAKNYQKFTMEVLRFNGPVNCGHPKNEELVIPYPSDSAQGIGPSTTAIDGDFYGVGVTVRHRCCNGSCCYETFELPKAMELSAYNKPDENGLHVVHRNQC